MYFSSPIRVLDYVYIHFYLRDLRAKQWCPIITHMSSYYTIRESGKDQTFRTVRHMHHVCMIHIRQNSVHGHPELLVV